MKFRVRGHACGKHPWRDEAVLDRTSRSWPPHLHGDADAAIDSILDPMEASRYSGVGVRALHCRIARCSILHDDQVKCMRALGMVPSFLINHVHYRGHCRRDDVFGSKKVQLLDRCQSVERAGLKWVTHTDGSVSPLRTLKQIRVAFARDPWKEPATILAPDERVSIEAAILLITRGAFRAYQSEGEIGSLGPGKLAGLVILGEDPCKVDPTAISNVRISETWLNGHRVNGG